MLGNRIPTLFVEDLKFFEIRGCYNTGIGFLCFIVFRIYLKKMDIVCVREEYLKKENALNSCHYAGGLFNSDFCVAMGFNFLRKTVFMF